MFFLNVDLKVKRFNDNDNDKGLKVIIVNDVNLEDGVENVVKKIVGCLEILGVVGYWVSEMIMVIKDIYDDVKLVMVFLGIIIFKFIVEERVDVFFWIIIMIIE